MVVNSARLQKLVKPLVTGALVLQGATPRVAEAADSLREPLSDSQEAQGMAALSTYLTADVTTDVVASFFEAAAALYERRPLERIPGDGHLFQVSCGALGMRGWTGCVIGQNREHYGVILFDSIEAYGRYVDLAGRAEQGEAGHAGADDVAQQGPGTAGRGGVAGPLQPGRGLIEQILHAAAQHRQGEAAIGRIEAGPLQGGQALLQLRDAAGALEHLAHLPLLLTADSEFHMDRRHGRQTISLLSP